jgi:hypothetical protein
MPALNGNCHTKMPQPGIIQIQLNTVTSALTIIANSLEIIVDSLSTPFLGAIVNTTHALLKNIEASLNLGVNINLNQS